ncbi:hydantoinase/oxoprolinase family protein [Pseudonocardia eucalypti]|uniref:Hydantoinase/oxoprolinase family protein n=1 Tax=Pseudonocardia eucalypti TaxID=648755 RepID=A0ABP9PVM2_9PSEU|nr:hypothetical protein [Pseudonocardia eucalypti]
MSALGIDLAPERATAVLLPGDGGPPVRRELPGEASVSDLVTGLADPATLAGIERVVVAAALPVSDLCGYGHTNHSQAQRVGVLRIGAPATTSVPPMTGWPAELAARVAGPVAVVRGGHRYDGMEFGPLDEPAVREFAATCRAAGVGAVAVTGTDAHINPAHEQRALSLLSELLDVPVITSHESGGAGLLERENTTVLNAAAAPGARRLVEEFGRSLAGAGIDADLYLMGGTGTVLPAARAARQPLHMLDASHGAARAGAAHLTGEADLVVVDAGAVGVRLSAQVDGLPRESGLPLEVCGVRTSLRPIRVVDVPGAPVGRAAGSRPESARPPGARAAGVSRAGLPGARAAGVRGAGLPGVRSAGVPGAGLRDALDRVAAGLDGVPVVVVGGGAGALAVPGVEPVRPAHARFAAAFGAAGGRAAATVDRLFWFGSGSREECVALARRIAREAAIRSGADPARVRVGEVREALMTYVPVRCVRLRVTATGPLLSSRGR